MKPSGKVNPVGVLIFAVLGAAIYWAFMIGPIYLQRTDVQGELQVAFNKFNIDKTPNIKTVLLMKLNDAESFGISLMPDEKGVLTRVPGLGVTDENLEYLPNDKLKELVVRLRYTRYIRLWPTNKIKTFNFVVETKGAYPH